MKILLSIVAAIAFAMMFATSDIGWVQLVISFSSISVFVLCCKLYEKFYMTEEEKEMKV